MASQHGAYGGGVPRSGATSFDRPGTCRNCTVARWDRESDILRTRRWRADSGRTKGELETVEDNRYRVLRTNERVATIDFTSAVRSREDSNEPTDLPRSD